MATLYRKYRPQNFAEIIGQNHIKITLMHEIETGRIAHAYLFCGPRAVGKTTLARVFAKAVNCLKRKEAESEPCNKCEVCQEITGARSLDIIEIDAASHTGVDNVRENIIASARVAPSRCCYKIFIIDEVHMLSVSAFNALLKILEEPPAQIIFILCTTEVHKVPLTIISRCQRFDFKRISVLEITKKLSYIASQENIKIDKKILENIARLSEGHMRDAESLLGQVVAIGGQEVTLEEADLVIPRSDLLEAINLIGMLSKKDAAQAISLVNKLVDEGVNLPRFLADVIELLRKILLNKINPALAEKLSLILGESLEIEITRASQNFEVSQILSIMEKLIEAKNGLKGSFIIQLPIEMAIAELCSAQVNRNYPAAAKFPNYPKGAGGGDKPSAPLPDKPVPSQGYAGSMTKEMITDKWHEVLARVKKYNHSLSFILRVCQPKDINGNQLCLAFRYKFHKDRIGEANIRVLVERVLQEVYGQPLTVEAIIDEKVVPPVYAQENGESGDQSAPEASLAGDGQAKGEKTEPKQAGENNGDNLVENLLKTFGGKIIK